MTLLNTSVILYLLAPTIHKTEVTTMVKKEMIAALQLYQLRDRYRGCPDSVPAPQAECPYRNRYPLGSGPQHWRSLGAAAL